MNVNSKAIFKGLVRSFSKFLGLIIVTKGVRQGMKDKMSRTTEVKGLK
jgi:hypothetical protein